MSEEYNFGNQQQSIIITYDEVLKQVADGITSQLLLIGIAVTLCALWHLFVFSRDSKWYMMITGAIDMMMFVAGIYLITLYAVTYWGFKPW